MPPGLVSRASSNLFRSADRFQYPQSAPQRQSLSVFAFTESDRHCGADWGWLVRLALGAFKSIFNTNHTQKGFSTLF